MMDFSHTFYSINGAHKGCQLCHASSHLTVMHHLTHLLWEMMLMNPQFFINVKDTFEFSSVSQSSINSFLNNRIPEFSLGVHMATFGC